jgi:hypothetical protein
MGLFERDWKNIRDLHSVRCHSLMAFLRFPVFQFHGWCRNRSQLLRFPLSVLRTVRKKVASKHSSSFCGVSISSWSLRPWVLRSDSSFLKGGSETIVNSV